MQISLSLAPDVQAALERGGPVVALESTLISHGLPYPHNLETAQQLEADVRAAGATPATIAILGGQPTIGLDAAALEHLAHSREVRKLSRRDLAAAIALGQNGATTVAATIALAAAAGITVFATGGIGGVHRGFEESLDISADLPELARTPVLVVCAGAKAILDLPATLEHLETLGVPVLGWQTDEFPAFYSRESGLPVPARVDTPAMAARVWQVQRAAPHLCAPGGMLLCVPPPAAVALPPADIKAALADALKHATTAGVRGPAVTPFLLAAIAATTQGESISTNVALLRQNAQIAARIATALARW